MQVVGPCDECHGALVSDELLVIEKRRLLLQGAESKSKRKTFCGSRESMGPGKSCQRPFPAYSPATMTAKTAASDFWGTRSSGSNLTSDRPRSEIVFWIAAVVVVFWHLGLRSLHGSEDRWAEVTREMFLRKDFFHPTLNGEPYFDKPLLGYWLV